jgi:predicted Zn-dependent protease
MRLSVRMDADSACAYSVQLDVSDELNARADGTRVFISTALTTFAEADDELALILAHELAHNILEHRVRFDREAPARRVFGNFAVAPSSLAAAERDADRWGLYLMARAGFDEGVAAPFWRRFGAANWRVRWAQWGHPSAETRARQLEAVEAEIVAARSSGRPIDPR